MFLRTTLLCALTVLVTLTGNVSAAEGELHHAGLVIRHGGGELTYAYVAFDEAEISGVELLERTGIDQVAVPFGSLGQGICSLEGEGCATGECRRNVCQSSGNAPYWRYFHQVEPGLWEPAPLGASQAKVRDGTIDAWVWTSSEAGLPAISMADLRDLAGVDETEGTGESEIPTPAVRSGYTSPADQDATTLGTLLAAAGAILFIVVAGLVAVFRSRRGMAR